jgi:hypothetical protein
LISFNGVSYGLNDFPPPEQNKPGTPEDGGEHARQDESPGDEGDKLFALDPIFVDVEIVLAIRNETSGQMKGVERLASA